MTDEYDLLPSNSGKSKFIRIPYPKNGHVILVVTSQRPGLDHGRSNRFSRKLTAQKHQKPRRGVPLLACARTAADVELLVKYRADVHHRAAPLKVLRHLDDVSLLGGS